MLKPPPIPATVPPSRAPGKPLVTWESLIGNPFNGEGEGASLLPGPLTIRAKGESPLVLNRTETSAAVSPAVYEIIEFERGGSVVGALGIDSSDHLVILAKDKTTVLAEFDTDASQGFSQLLARDHVAAVLPFLAIKRRAVTIGYLGCDASDRLALIANDGTTVIAFLSNTGDWEAAGHVKATLYQDSAGHQVLSTQQPAIANAAATTGSPAGTDGTGGVPTDPATLGDVDGVYGVTNAYEARIANLEGSVATLISKLNTLLAELRAATGHGVIA